MVRTSIETQGAWGLRKGTFLTAATRPSNRLYASTTVPKAPLPKVRPYSRCEPRRSNSNLPTSAGSEPN
eukprot:1066267-Prorocentrum_minimum.AAC.1